MRVVESLSDLSPWGRGRSSEWLLRRNLVQEVVSEDIKVCCRVVDEQGQAAGLRQMVGAGKSLLLLSLLSNEAIICVRRLRSQSHGLRK